MRIAWDASFPPFRYLSIIYIQGLELELERNWKNDFDLQFSISQVIGKPKILSLTFFSFAWARNKYILNNAVFGRSPNRLKFARVFFLDRNGRTGAESFYQFQVMSMSHGILLELYWFLHYYFESRNINSLRSFEPFIAKNSDMYRRISMLVLTWS